MVKRACLDTNVLVALLTGGHPQRGTMNQLLEELVAAGTELWISRQILRELAAALVKTQRRYGTPAMSDIIAALRYAQSCYYIAEDGPAVTERHLELLLSKPDCSPGLVHDLNIIATMQVHGIESIITFDSDFLQFADELDVRWISSAPPAV